MQHEDNMKSLKIDPETHQSGDHQWRSGLPGGLGGEVGVGWNWSGLFGAERAVDNNTCDVNSRDIVPLGFF